MSFRHSKRMSTFGSKADLPLKCDVRFTPNSGHSRLIRSPRRLQQALELTRAQTIMQGADHCDFNYKLVDGNDG